VKRSRASVFQKVYHKNCRPVTAQAAQNMIRCYQMTVNYTMKRKCLIQSIQGEKGPLNGLCRRKKRQQPSRSALAEVYCPSTRERKRRLRRNDLGSNTALATARQTSIQKKTRGGRAQQVAACSDNLCCQMCGCSDHRRGSQYVAQKEGKKKCISGAFRHRRSRVLHR